jgi:hypothetical protein
MGVFPRTDLIIGLCYLLAKLLLYLPAKLPVRAYRSAHLANKKALHCGALKVHSIKESYMMNKLSPRPLFLHHAASNSP